MRQKDNKNHGIRVRLTDDEKALIQLCADRQGKKLSEFVREIISWNCRFDADPRAVKEELIALRRDLNSGIGNNINQIAYQMNSGQGRPDTKILRKMSTDLEAARKRINLSLSLMDAPLVELLRDA